MTRRNAAWLVAAVAAVLAGLYVVTRRRAASPGLARPETHSPVEPSEAAPVRVPAPVAVAEPVTAVAEPVTATLTVPAASAPVQAAAPPQPATVPVASAPVQAAAPVVAAVPAAPPQPAADPVEPPLPTWVRLAIVGVALVAFFAVSLIATKGV